MEAEDSSRLSSLTHRDALGHHFLRFHLNFFVLGLVKAECGMMIKQFTCSSHPGLLVTIMTSGKRKLKFAVGLGTKKKNKERSGGPVLRFCCGRGTLPAHGISLSSSSLICKIQKMMVHKPWHTVSGT